MRHLRGFTLVELLVVFALMALMVSIVPPAYDRLQEGSQYRDAVRGLLSNIRQARTRAMSEGREVRLVMDLAGHTYGVEGAAVHKLPQKVELRATIAGIEMAANGQAAIRFLPSGGATGGTIELRRASGGGVRLTVDWLSGAVLQAPVQP